MKDTRILPLKPGEFRHRLNISNVNTDGMEVYELINPFDRIEKVAIFIDRPIKITYINYHGSKITHKKDPYLMELVDDLMFFNPTISEIGIKKMIQFIISRCAKRYDNVPVLKYEDIYDTVVAYTKAALMKQPKLLTDVIVLFEENTMLEAEERRSISLQARSMRGSMLNGELIHNAAITAIKLTKGKLRITRPRVLERVEDKRIKTVRTLNKHIREDTVDLLTKANEKRYFIMESSANKYKKFLTLPDGMTNAEVASKLNISITTVVQFKKIRG